MNDYNIYELLSVSKPLRYAGGEQGQVLKDPADKLRFCLIFPDIYEIGMSTLGFRIIYSALNRSNNIFAERFFAPWPDAWAKLGSDVMRSLETHKPIKEFDVVGFSINYELSYTTVAAVLKMSNIPMRAKDRNENDPIIIAGGTCVLNPAPLSKIIDVFYMGEMDEEIALSMEKVYEMKKQGASKKALLEMLNELPYTYIPQIDKNKRVKREIYTKFHSDENMVEPLVPLMGVIQDRVTLEVARGCTNGCRFCQAGMVYRPAREKSVKTLVNSALCQTERTGYQEVSLLSLDIGDYSQLEPLLNTLNDNLTKKRISLSLPSIRAETVSEELMEKVGAVRKSGFTIAPEAGSQRMRDIINKNLTEEDIINAAVYAKNAGYNGAKLYFMCGLPFETDDDLLEIAHLVKKIKYAVKGGGKGFNLTVSVSNYVPKPHTPFERYPQNTPDEFHRKHCLIKDALRPTKVLVRIHGLSTSHIEGVLSRGDERLSDLIIQAADQGFYLDAWSEFFSRAKWEELLHSAGYNAFEFACKEYAEDETLPWHMVDIGVTEEFMRKEREKAKNLERTKDCRNNKCTGCGICDFKMIKNIAAESVDINEAGTDEKSPSYKKYKLVYSKKDTSALMSALDLTRIIIHIMLASGVEFKFSEGYNPMPRLLVPAPTPVGVEGENDELLFVANESSITNETIEKLNKLAPAGFIVKSIEEHEWPKNLSNFRMKIRLDKSSFTHLLNRLNTSEAKYSKENKKGVMKDINLNDFLLSVDEENSIIEVKVTDKGAFHLPEFFKRTNYDKIPVITRISLASYEEQT